MAESTELLQGTLDLLILRTLALAPTHGWAISKRVQELSKDTLRVHQGSLYPALYRLEDKGWIDAEWGHSAEGRRVRVYRLTAAGKRAFANETASWRQFAASVELVLRGS